MQYGDIVFVQGKGIVTDIIRFFDKGKFSHVCVAMSDKTIIEAQYNEKVSMNPFDKKYYNEIEVIDLGLTPKQRNDVYFASIELIGTKYDKLQLLGYVLKDIFHLKGKNILNNPNNLICSELVYVVLEVTGIWKELGIDSEDIRGIDLTPNQLYDLLKYLAVNK